MTSGDQDPERPDVSRTDLLTSLSTEDSPDEESTRRRFMAGAAAAAATLGFSGTASALDPMGGYALRERERAFADVETAHAAFRHHGEELLSHLADEEVLDETVETLLADETPDVSAFKMGDEPTAHLHVERELDEGRLGINVEPDTGRRYAVLVPDEGKATVFDPDSDVQPQCTAVAGCMGNGCTCPEYEVCCDIQRMTCYNNGKTGATCSSCAKCTNDSCSDICF